MNDHPPAKTVLYLVSYRDPAYIRTQSISAALTQSSHRVKEIRNHRAGWSRYPEILWRLHKELKAGGPDVVILGFRGYEIFEIVRKMIGSTPLVFDAFVSPSDSLIVEKKHGSLGVLTGRMIRRLEYRSLHSSDAVLVDTDLLAAHLANHYRIAPDRFHTVRIGAADPGAAVKASPGKKLEVLFYGSFLPLHGVDVILRAARSILHENIHFHLVGGEHRGAEIVEAAGLSNVTHTSWIPYDELVDEIIPSADLLLGGPFGNTPQALRVFTGKAVQGLASATATVIGKIAEDVGLSDRENCLLVSQGSVEELVTQLRWAAEHRSELRAIGSAGRLVYEKEFAPHPTAKRLERAIDYAVDHRAAIETRSSSDASQASGSKLKRVRYLPPRYLFRRSELLRRIKGGSTFLEVGAGDLTLTTELLKKFATGTAMELTDEIVEIHRKMPPVLSERLTCLVGDVFSSTLPSGVDVVVSCEVMEHIDEDLEFLRRLHSALRPGGQILVSVPARAKYWTNHDDFVGHLRRYEKDELVELFREAGFVNVEVVSYGFPFVNFLRLPRSMLAASQQSSRTNWSAADRTVESNHRQIPERLSSSPLRFLTRPLLVAPLALLTRPFNRFDRSDGYVVTAISPRRGLIGSLMRPVVP